MDFAFDCQKRYIFKSVIDKMQQVFFNILNLTVRKGYDWFVSSAR